MALLVYNREDFRQELFRRNIKPTNLTTVTGRLWVTENGVYISVPESDEYPDYVLDAVLAQIGKLYE